MGVLALPVFGFATQVLLLPMLVLLVSCLPFTQAVAPSPPYSKVLPRACTQARMPKQAS